MNPPCPPSNRARKGVPVASEKRDWLILSVKWSNGDWLFRWYATASAGYTSSLIHAGRYTEAEARGEERRADGQILAVKLECVADFYAADLVIRNEQPTRERLTKEAKLWAARHPLDTLHGDQVKGGEV